MRAQAALKALTEMDCISEPTPEDQQRAQSALASAPATPPPSPPASAQPPPRRRQSEPGGGAPFGAPRSSTADIGSASSSKAAAALRRAMPRHASENAAKGGGAASKKRGEGMRRKWAPLQDVDANSGAPHARTEDARADGSADEPILDRQQQRSNSLDEAGVRGPRLRMQGAGGFDFGVQVYAPPRPAAAAAPAAAQPQSAGVADPESLHQAIMPHSLAAAVGDSTRSAAEELRAAPSAAGMADAPWQVDVAVLLQQLRHFQGMAEAVTSTPLQPAADSTPAAVAQPLHPCTSPGLNTSSAGGRVLSTEQQSSPALGHADSSASHAEPATPQAQVAAAAQVAGATEALQPWEATPGAKALVAGQQGLMAQLQQVRLLQQWPACFTYHANCMR